MKHACVVFAMLLYASAVSAGHEPWTHTEFPQDKDRTWWDDGWWQEGRLDTPENHTVTMERIEYRSGDTMVPAYLFRPKKSGRYLPVLFQHGRRGLDDLTLLVPRRLAARGFVVLAPDVWSARLIGQYPIAHDYSVEMDVARGIDALLTLPNVKGKRACIVSHTRGGYLALKALVTYQKQKTEVACYVSYYPHWQDPNKPESMQVYEYAPEINDLKVPVLVFFGEHEQYQRLRPIMDGIKSLEELGRKPQLIVYPGVGRGFEFRPPDVRTFADDLAAKDALRRTELFIRSHLAR